MGLPEAARRVRRRRWYVAAVLAAVACGAVAAPPPAASSLPARDDWFGIYMGGAKIGWSHASVRPEAGRPGVHRISDETYMRLAQMGVTVEMTVRYDAFVRDDLSPLGFEFRTENPMQTVSASGKVEKDRLRVDVRTGGETRTEEIDVAGVDLFGLNELKAARDGYDVGDVVEGRIFEPVSLRAVPYRLEVVDTETMRVGDAETTVYVVTTRIQGIETRSWLTRDGSMLRSIAPMGIEMRREDERTARAPGARGVTDIVLKMTVPAPWPSTAQPRRARRMTALFGGAPDSPEGMSGGVQSISRGETPGEVRIVVDLDHPAADPPPDASTTAPSVYVQSDHPRIVEAARAAAGDGPPAARLAALVRWVHDAMTRAPAFTLPSALDVLESRRGDCNEHAVLLAALARAEGIPCRVAAGLVWLDGSFYYHAWNEAWLDGAWRPVDATFGQATADATHVRLVAGDLDAQMRIAEVAGRLTARILEASE